jgi:GMC oxidoreductase
MMLIDARKIDDGAILEGDICIVGAGAAGLTIASEFANSKAAIIIIESGAVSARKDSQVLSQGYSDAAAHPPPDLYRQRKVGGSTGIWGGRCVPFDDIDFEERKFVPHSGWPFDRKHLAPYYHKSMGYCEAGTFDFDSHTALPAPSGIVDGFISRDIEDRWIERFSMPTDFGRRFLRNHGTAPNIKLIVNATCTALLQDDRDAVSGARILTFLGNAATVRAKIFVVAVGGLETVRLLSTCATLLSGRKHLGRYYMCHVEGTMGVLKLKPKSRRVVWQFERTFDGIYARRRFSVAAHAQRRLESMGLIARLHYPHVGDPAHKNGVLSAMYLTKKFVIPEFRRKFSNADRTSMTAAVDQRGIVTGHIRNVVSDSARLIQFSSSWVWARYLQRRRIPAVALYSPIGEYPLDFNSEQSPNPDSRVLFAESLDQFGMPKLKVSWRMSERDIRSIAANYRLMRDAFAVSGVADLVFDDATLEDEIAVSTPVGGHHIGTARMATSSSTGVVDAFGLAFGTTNLYIAGSATFPTSSHANPTLTIVATALRLAEHLRSKV